MNNKSQSQQIIDQSIEQDYKYGFTTNIEQDTLEPGLNEDIIKTISKKKEEPEWLLKWRLKAFRHWQKMSSPDWAKINYPAINRRSPKFRFFFVIWRFDSTFSAWYLRYL